MFLIDFNGMSVCLGLFYAYTLGNRGGSRDVMVIVVGNEHGDTSSNPGRD